jgi:hypothetical protein
MKKILFCALGAATIAAGCASTETSTEPTAERASRGDYTTGSNIPRKSRDGVTTISPEALERAKNSVPAGTGRGQ